jgi:hypothetical protein
MCNRYGWHEAESDAMQLGGDLTLTQKCLLHSVLYRDWHLTTGEMLAKLTAQAETERESEGSPALPTGP